jgi:hypothetical protein
MKPDEMLKQAKAVPEKQELDLYLETIWELRGKGKSYREIAEFLNERGVVTDHTAVYRLIAVNNPLLNYRDGRVLLGDVEYESRIGRPLRPFSAGLFIAITKRLMILPLNRAAPVGAIWCEAQFELNEAPNYVWLHQLCQCLHIDWNPEHPTHLRGRFGLELKFEGSLMAMICNTYNLEKMMQDVGASVKEATKFFEKDNERFSRRQKLISERNAEILEHVVIHPGESKDDVCEECLEWIRNDAKKLSEKFNSIPMP